jgi:3-deoxy-manno-octulosonate cytidylyltransferase (CMP-KDO synthetase)
MTHFVVVIPARHGSTRLPGKMLADIAGKPLVIHTAERAQRSSAAEVIIVTDHADIAAAATQHGYAAHMTRADHASGTDRIAEIATQRGWADDTLIVNVQGDEPLIDPGLINVVAQTLVSHPTAAMASACCVIADTEEFTNPNVVKVVLDAAGFALYFSRAPIPHLRDTLPLTPHTSPPGAYRHIGIYAYRVGFLRTYTQLPPAPLEQSEALEQLRALWHGYRIVLTITDAAPVAGVDTAADLARVRAAMAKPL